MLDQIIMIVATAVLSSLLTVALAVLLFRGYAARVEERLEQRLHERLAQAAEEVGETIEARLRKVVRDAVGDFKAASLAAGATRTVATTGAELVQEGLRILMGGGPRPPGPSTGSGRGSGS
jgi:type II secretory pathway pseudopilin PulG